MPDLRRDVGDLVLMGFSGDDTRLTTNFKTCWEVKT